MADVNRRKGGPTAARSHQNYLQNAAANAAAQNPQFQAYQQQQQQQQLQQQQSPYQYQFQQQQLYKQQQQAKMAGASQAASNRYTRDRAGPARGGGGQQKSPVSAKMGIKSGMTVEDLKRLTQKRMQQGSSSAAALPATPKASVAPVPQEPHMSSRPSTPTINMSVVNAGTAAPVVPKTGMTVQELKQLTTLRLASQSVPMHQSEITGLVSKAVLTNVAKSHYRDSLRNSLTPSGTPKRGPAAATRGNPSTLNLAAPEVRGNRSRSRSSQLAKTVEPPSEATQMRYSYSGGQTIDDYLSFDNGDGSNSSQETDSYVRPSLDQDEDSRYTYDEPTHHSLQFPDDSFPPPPPMDENGGFVANSLPSWSPPPTKAKKYDSSGSASFYNQQTSYYNIASKEENAALDQNAVIAPPPGLSRRPSMTVPWQVAEAVLNTPQTATNRKQLVSPGGSSKNASEPESSNMFATSSKSSSRSNAAEAAAQLSAMSLQMGRQRSGTGGGGGASSSMTQPGPPPPAPLGQTLTAGARRGSFGNAAEFFKFRRRSKSRLELARDLSGNFVSEGEVIPGFPNYGTSGGVGAMPGIDESRADLQDNFSVMANADTVSDASSSSSDNGSSSQGYDDDEIVQITGGYDDPNEIAGNFVSFYHATGAGRAGRDNLSGLSNLSIPPPPPPPLTDDEDASSTTSSSKGLPIMSPNGFRLRKVAELARRGSLSSEDKTRAKDEIIQSSLGIGASNAARIFSSKMGERPSSVTTSQPPPGFAVMSATPPRNTPKATMTKTLTPGAGIVRSNSISGPPPKLSPRTTTATATATATASGSRKVLNGNESGGESGNASSLEERLASAAQRVADCVGKGDMVGFQKAMEELDWLRNEANSLMRG